MNRFLISILIFFAAGSSFADGLYFSGISTANILNFSAYSCSQIAENDTFNAPQVTGPIIEYPELTISYKSDKFDYFHLANVQVVFPKSELLPNGFSTALNPMELGYIFQQNNIKANSSIKSICGIKIGDFNFNKAAKNRTAVGKMIFKGFAAESDNTILENQKYEYPIKVIYSDAPTR